MAVRIFSLAKKDFEKVETAFGSFLVARYFNESGKRFSSGFFAVERERSFEWAYWYDEVVYVVSGEGEFSYSTPPLFDGNELKKLLPGNLIVIERSSRVKIVCTSKQPLVFAYVAMP